MEPAHLDVNFFDPQLVADPYPTYEAIRAAGPVVRNDAFGCWMVTNFPECSAILTNDGSEYLMMNGPESGVTWFDADNMIRVDGADHQRLRRCLAPLFTRAAVAHWERRVGEVVDELLAPLAGGADEIDLIADFTMIPTVIVAEMLGVPPERHEDFRRWSHGIVANLAYGHEDPGARRRLDEAAGEAKAYLDQEIARHKQESHDDLLSTMIVMADMTDEEITSTALLLLLAGYDTTAKLMANAVHALALHPEERQRLVDDPALGPAAIEEVLRWYSPTQSTPRKVARDHRLAGVELKEGDTVYALVAAANRDANRWEDPHRFDITRAPKANLGFGFGPHLCLGAPLARLEVNVAVQRLLSLAPEYGLHDLDNGRGFFVRGPEKGTISLTSGPRETRGERPAALNG